MKNPFSCFNTDRIIIALLMACFALLPQGAFSQEEKLPRLMIEDLDEEPIWFFEYFENTNELLTSNRHGVAVWNMDNGELIARYQVSCGGSVSLSKSGRFMAVGCGNNRMFVYDRDRDDVVFEYSIPPIPGPSSVFGWFTNQENLLVITYLASVEVWDIEKNERLFDESLPRLGITQRNVQFYSNGDLFLVNNAVFSLMMERSLFQIGLHQGYLTRDNRFILGLEFVGIGDTNYPQIVRHDAMTGELLAEYEPIMELSPIIRFAPDGNHAIIAKSQLEPENEGIRDVELFDVADSSVSPVGRFVSAQRESYRVREMKFFHGGKTLAIASGPRLYIYDTSDLITDVSISELHED